MSDSSKNSFQRRQSLLSVVMLGVLLCSVGVGWLVIRGARVSQKRGEEILRRIREQTLRSLWDSQRVELWYLGTDGGGRKVGWRRVTRNLADGAYIGTLYHARENFRAQSRWTLNAEATEGSYIANESTPGKRLITRITFKEGTVTLRSNILRTSVRTVAPANYIPEGLSELVYFLAADGNTDAVCQMVFDGDPVQGGRVNFRTITLRPEGEGGLRWTASGGVGQTIYQFDNSGAIESIEHPDERVVYRRVPRSEVEVHFPEAGIFVEDDAKEPEELSEEEDSTGSI
jgi:hypothetical protein